MGVVHVRDPLFYVVLFCVALLLLYVDHLPYPLRVDDIFDNEFHHEDLMLLCLIGLVYSLWKLLH